jgi:NAD(P)-dependent dehydrogenase (short-subunit alcohol dehydrogenase family)
MTTPSGSPIMSLDGRVAIVTGGGRGIGREYCMALAGAGATVIAADIDLDGAEETVALVAKEGGTGCALHVDVSNRDSTLAVATAVRERFGRAAILVNNAAVYHSMRMDPQLTVDIDYWRQVFAVNLDGALLMTQAFAPMMIEAGWGRIIMQTSTAAYLGGGGHYGVSKLALLGLTRGFAKELGPHGITVNAIAPGVIATEATAATVPAEKLAALAAITPLQRQAGPEDLTGTLLFLCSEAAAWMTGQTLIVDGGMVVRY